jgi:hypothetical protein
MIGIVKGYMELENNTNSLTPGAVSQSAHRLLDMSALSYLLRKGITCTEDDTANLVFRLLSWLLPVSCPAWKGCARDSGS